MKRILKYIITAILLITVNLSYAQETVNLILTGKATAINFGIGDTIGLITGFSDQTGFGFTLDSLKTNAVIIDQSGTIWKVDTITSQNALQAAIKIQKVYGSSLFPSGEVAISNVTTNYKFPSPATTNSTGITPKQQAEMLNYIIQKIDQQITEGSGGGGTTQLLSFSDPNLSISGGNTVDLSALKDGTGTDDQTAAEVPVTPTGNLSSTDVQAALEEHQSDINALSSGAADGVATAGTYDAINKEIDITVAAPGSNFSIDVSAFLDNTDSISFNTTYTLDPQRGTLIWNNDDETLDLGINGVILQIGQEMFTHIKNQTGSTIENGTAVRYSGSVGASGRMNGDLMIADGTYSSYYTLGIATEDIPNGEDGFVTTFGVVRGINTTAYSAGDVLYVSTTIEGALTDTVPEAPDLKIPIAVVLNSSNNGAIFVRPTILPALNDIADIEITSPVDNSILKYDSTAGTWIDANDSDEQTLDFTNLNLSIENGNSLDLSSVLPFYKSGGLVLPNFTSTNMELRLNSTETYGGNLIRSRIGAAGDFLWAIGDDGSLFGQGRNGLNAYVYGNYPFIVATNAARRLIVTGSGDVGINTLNPSFRLDVNGTVGFPALSDGSLHAELVTRNNVTGELGYRDISSIGLSESEVSAIVSDTADVLRTIIPNFDSMVVAKYSYQTFFDKRDKDSIINVLLIGDSRVERGQTPGELAELFWDKYGYSGYGSFSLTGNISNQHFSRATVGVTEYDLSGDANLSPIGRASSLSLDGWVEITPILGKEEYTAYNSFDLYYKGNSGVGMIEIKVDDVSVDSFVLSGTGVQKYTLTGLTNEPHKIRITNIGEDSATIFEINLKLDQKGVRFHRLGNSGISTGGMVTLKDNTYIYEDIKPDLVYVRLGVNGGSGSVVNQRINMDTIITSIKQVGGLDSLSRFVIIGETDNTEIPTLRDNMPALNREYKRFALQNNYGFIDLFTSVPDWENFQKLGYSDDTVHENERGAKYIAQAIFQDLEGNGEKINDTYEVYIEADSLYVIDDYGEKNSYYFPASAVNNGTVNRLAYYSESDKISNLDKWVVNGDNLGYYSNTSAVLSLAKTNSTVLGLGATTGGPNQNWFNFADKSGYISLSWFSYYDGSNWRQTGGSVAPSRITTDAAGDINFETGTNNGVDSVITWSKVMEIKDSGVDITGDLNASGGATVENLVDGSSHSELVTRNAVTGELGYATNNISNWNTAYGWGDHSIAGYLTSEVDGSTTNELQTIDEVLTQGNSLAANRSINVNGNQMQIGGTYAAMLARTFDITLSSFDLSLNTADIITDTGEIILRHRLQGDGSDQDYMYLKAAGLDLAHRNNISLNSDSLSINAPTLTLDQNTTLQSGGFSLTNEMTGSSFYRINTSDAVVNIQPNYIDQTVDGLSGDTRILQGFGGIDISRNTTGDTGYPDFIFMDNDTLSLNHTEQINIDAPIIEINGEKMRTGGPQQVSISGTSGSINLGSLRSQVVQIDMTSASTASPISITITNPISNGTYTFHWQNTDSGGHDLDLPANMLNAAGTAFDGSTTITYDADDWFTCYYDGINFYCK